VAAWVAGMVSLGRRLAAWAGLFALGPPCWLAALRQARHLACSYTGTALPAQRVASSSGRVSPGGLWRAQRLRVVRLTRF
jgi:hypothetical protein